MYLVQNLNRWSATHGAGWMDIIRFFLGAFIFYKGIFFMHHTEVLIDILNHPDAFFTLMLTTHYVTMGHLAGGLLISAGLLTRIAVIVQMPILLGAVFVNSFITFSANELIQSLLVLVILVVFLLYGSGKYSFDHYIKRDKGDDF